MNGLPNTTIEAQTKMRQSKDTILLVDDELKHLSVTREVSCFSSKVHALPKLPISWLREIGFRTGLNTSTTYSMLLQ